MSRTTFFTVALGPYELFVLPYISQREYGLEPGQPAESLLKSLPLVRNIVEG